MGFSVVIRGSRPQIVNVKFSGKKIRAIQNQTVSEPSPELIYLNEKVVKCPVQFCGTTIHGQSDYPQKCEVGLSLNDPEWSPL